MTEERAVHHVDWSDTTPIETRVERLRGGLHGLADSVLRVEDRQEKFMPILDEIKKTLAEHAGATRLTRHPLVVAVVVGVIGFLGQVLIAKGWAK